MDLEAITQSEVSQKEKNEYHGLTHICGIWKNGIFVVQSLSRVRLSMAQWTMACQAPLTLTISRSLLELMSFESVMPSSHLTPLSSPSPALNLSSITVFSNQSRGSLDSNCSSLNLRQVWPSWLVLRSGICSTKTLWLLGGKRGSSIHGEKGQGQNGAEII